MQNGIPEFLHIGNHWEMQEFLVISAYSGIGRKCRNRQELQEFLVIPFSCNSGILKRNCILIHIARFI
jgi:hypothetical protein